MTDYIDMYGVLETVPSDGLPSVYVSPDRRYWPNPVSGHHLALIAGPDGVEEEHWYDGEGRAVEKDSPPIRNRQPKLQKDRMFAAFVGGFAAAKSDSGFSEEELFESWYADNKLALGAIGA